MYPVHFNRIIEIAANTQNKEGPPPITDLDPAYILDRIDEVSSIYVTKVQPANKLLGILARYYLSPKRILLKYRLIKSTFDFIIEQIKARFYESLVHPSEMVGVIAAHSNGEILTQLTLNSFHSAGISSASKSIRGVPRLKELLDVTRDIRSPVMLVKLKENISTDKSLCLKATKDIQIVRFKDVVKAVRIYFDPDDFNTNIPEDKHIIDLYREFNNNPNTFSNLSPWLLRLEFDQVKLDEFNLDMVKIVQSLDKFYEDRIFCVNSDDNADEIVIRIKLKLSPDFEKNASDSDDILTELRALEFQIMENFVIRGIDKIENAEIDEETSKVWNPITKEFVEKKQFVIYTSGSNMRDIMSMDIVDAKRTKTNDVNEIYNVLGIEAARSVLYDEIAEALSNVNYRHIALLIDVMTNKGNILSINRHGINRGDIGPLAKCSFEETTDKLVKAGMFAEYDKINGVSANIMVGQIVPAGTGDIGIYMDESLLPKVSKEDFLSSIKEEDEENDEENDQNLCVEENIRANIPIPTSVTIGAGPSAERTFARKVNNNVEIV